MSSRRRTFIFKGQSAAGRDINGEILAMDEAAVRSWAERNHYSVEYIRPKPRAARGSRKRWSIDPAKLRQVIEFYGIECPVHITVGQGARTVGWCSTRFGWQLPDSAPDALKREPIVHYVCVSGRESAEAASRTLWHELCHAMQAERAMADDPSADFLSKMRKVRAHHNAQHAIPYSARPIEVEARSYEDYAGEIAPCA